MQARHSIAVGSQNQRWEVWHVKLEVNVNNVHNERRGGRGGKKSPAEWWTFSHEKGQVGLEMFTVTASAAEEQSCDIKLSVSDATDWRHCRRCSHNGCVCQEPRAGEWLKDDWETIRNRRIKCLRLRASLLWSFSHTWEFGYDPCL